ncbi:hypothetical protein CS542_00115 [Pedobacter sp. IW39]|nr:hypothetical protein CS542_00115 [Pedobacter sp. IW39]
MREWWLKRPNIQIRGQCICGQTSGLLRPRDNRITVERLSGVDKLNGRTEAYDYLYPQYAGYSDAYKEFA